MSNNNYLNKLIEDVSANFELFKKITKLVEITDQINNLESERKLLFKNFSPVDYLTLARAIKDNKDN